MVMPSSVTGTSATLMSLAIGERLAVTIRPPAPTITNIKYMSVKTGWPRDMTMALPAIKDQSAARASGIQKP